MDEEVVSELKQALRDFVQELRSLKDEPERATVSDRENTLLAAVGLNESSFKKAMDGFVLEQEVRSINDKMDTIIGLLENGGA